MSKKASVNYCHATVKEALEMTATTYEITKVGGKGNTLIGYLTDKGVVEETGEEGKYQVNVVKLTGKKLQLGNGSNGKDVYMLEEVGVGTAKVGRYASTEELKIAETESTKKEYNIKYYGKKAEENVDLGKLTDGGEVSNLSEQEKLLKEIEDMYYIYAWWDSEENRFNEFYLYLLPEVEDKVEEYVINEKTGKMTDEEILAKRDGFNTFEEMIEEYIGEGYIYEKYSTAREYLKNDSYYGYNGEMSDEEYEEEILNAKKAIIGDIEINNPAGYTTEPGEYKYTVKVADEKILDFTITIDQYEVIGWNNDDIGQLVVSVYDFVNNKTLKIDSASYEYKEYGEINYTKGTITAEQIVNEGNISYLQETIANSDTIYKYNIKGEEKQISGYYYLGPAMG